jgi:hypothetical protein
MNERIAKLYDQAIVIEDGGDYVCGELDPVKFAELVIRECADHAVDFNNNNQHLPDKVMRGNLYRVSAYIKDRMGITNE